MPSLADFYMMASSGMAGVAPAGHASDRAVTRAAGPQGQRPQLLHAGVPRQHGAGLDGRWTASRAAPGRPQQHRDDHQPDEHRDRQGDLPFAWLFLIAPFRTPGIRRVFRERDMERDGYDIRTASSLSTIARVTIDQIVRMSLYGFCNRTECPMNALTTFAVFMVLLPLTAPAQSIDCPDVVLGLRLGIVDVFSGPPADNYLQTPNQPGNRDIWPDLDKGPKPTFVVCRYKGGPARQFQLSSFIKVCRAVRASNDTHVGLSCQ